MKTEWDFANLQNYDWKKKREEIKKAYLGFRDKYRENKDYLKKPEALKVALDEFENLQRNFSGGQDEGYSCALKIDLDETNKDYRKNLNEIEDFVINLGNEIRFFELEIGKIPAEKQKEFLESNLLKSYKHLLERIFLFSKHALKEDEEKIISLKARSSYDMWVKMISSLLSKETRKIKGPDGKEREMTYAELLSLMKLQDKEIRKEARDIFEEILEKYKEVAEFEINAILEDKKIDDKLRGFKRPDESRHLSDDIDSKVVDTMINAVTKRFSISHDYYKFKSKLLGLEKMDYSEKTIEYGEITKEYPYEESVNLVRKVFYGIDEEFGKIFDRFFNNGFVDAFPRKGKRFGAACYHNTISQPTYIILNHTRKLDDVLTIGHETGHGINNELMKKKLKAIEFESPLSTAEVASTFFEDFVLEEILKEANEEEKLVILMEKLDRDISSIQRQTGCYNFEKELHKTYRKEGFLPLEKIEKIFKKHMSAYLGEAVDVSKSGNWWIYWPHIREYFYVYSYSSGLLISKAMQKKFKEDKNFISKIKDFLGAGTSKSPKEIFSEMGIDITQESFWNEGLDKVEDLLNEAKALAKKLGKV